MKTKVRQSQRIPRAQAALKAFNLLKPGLTGYARAVTGRRDLRIEATGSAPHTDGRTIFYRPPISLADDIKHDRSVCDKRDDTTLQQLCAACALREEILVSMYHEIAHIAYHSMQPFTDADRKDAMLKGVTLKGDAYSATMKVRLDSFRSDQMGNTFMALATSVSEFLPGLVNILEDVRIDERMFQARKGVRRMREARARRAFTVGVDQADGSILRWSEAPLNAQLTVGMYAEACEWSLDGHFDSGVVEALVSESISTLARSAKTARSASDVFNIAFEVLVEGKKLGFFAEVSDPQPEPEQQKSDDKQDKSESGPDNEDDTPEKSSDPEKGEGDDKQEDSNETPSEDDSQDQSDVSGDDLEEQSTEEFSSESPESEGEAGAGEPSDDRSEDSDTDTSESAEQHDSHSDETANEYEEDQGTDNPREGSQDAPEESEDSSEEGEESSNADTGSGNTSDELGDDTDCADDGDDSAEAADHDSSGQLDGTGKGERADPSREEEGEELSDTGSGSGGDNPQESDKSSDNDGSPELAGSGDYTDTDNVDSKYEVAVDPRAECGKDTVEEDRSKDSDESSGDGDSSWESDHTDEPVEKDSAGDAEPIDTGEYEEDGAIESDRPAMGGAGSIPEYVEAVTGHHGDHHAESSEDYNEQADNEALKVAIVQGVYFETPPQNVTGVSIHRYDRPSVIKEDAWRGTNGGLTVRYMESDYKKIGLRGDFNVPESVLGSALLMTRRAFEDNARAKHMKNLKSGKVRGPSLAKRAPLGDPRMFKKSVLPGKKSYAVLIGIDISGSTAGRNIILAKRAAKAQAELCARTGIDFAVYAHTATGDDNSELSLEIYEIKAFGEQWNTQAKEALDNIGSFSYNLDGHTMEYYRKAIERQPATDKIILYYTDGKMPASNYHEELDVLQREIKRCKQLGIVLLGVGIRTDSPTRHGLDTVQVDTDQDLAKVVRHLEKRLVNR